jgi:hypothetical protein
MKRRRRGSPSIVGDHGAGREVGLLVLAEDCFRLRLMWVWSLVLAARQGYLGAVRLLCSSDCMPFRCCGMHRAIGVSLGSSFDRRGYTR